MLLAELGFDVNLRARNTALHEAAWRGDLDVVEALLELGADPTMSRPPGAPPAGWADHAGKTEVAERLAAMSGDAPASRSGLKFARAAADK